MSLLRIGIIGCGRISVIYKEILLGMADKAIPVIAIDKDIERAKDFASYFSGCKYSTEITDLEKIKPDVVHVLTPHFLHKEHVCKALRAGCNVLTEKPIAITMEDAREMISVAKETGKKLGVIFQNRYIEGIQEVRKLIEKGAFGKITGAWSHLAWHRPPSYYQCDWKGSWEKEGGGVVIDQAIHSIDLVKYLMGCPVSTIQAHISRRVLTMIEVEDEADAVITFENGARYSFFACNYFVKNSPIRIEIAGEKGNAVLTEDKVEVTIYGKEPYTICSNAKEVKGERYWGSYHAYQIKDYYNKIIEGKEVPFAPEDAAETLAIVLGIYKSGKNSECIVMPEKL